MFRSLSVASSAWNFSESRNNLQTGRQYSFAVANLYLGWFVTRAPGVLVPRFDLLQEEPGISRPYVKETKM